MKRISLDLNSKALEPHRDYYSLPIGRLLQMLSTGLDDAGRPCRVFRYKGHVDWVDVVGRLCIRPQLAWFYGLHRKYDIPACPSDRIRDLAEELRQGPTGGLRGVRGWLLKRLMKDLFAYGHFCFGEMLVIDLKRVVSGVAEYRCWWKGCGRGKASSWSAWHYYRYLTEDASSPLRYCPYCNADTLYAFTFNGCTGKDADLRFARSALDHFYSQKDYPALAMTLSNLVPACTRCNSRFKADGDVDANGLGLALPYVDDMDGLFRFTWGNQVGQALICACTPRTIKVEFEDEEQMKNTLAGRTLECFHIKDVYKCMFAREICEIPLMLNAAYSLVDVDSARVLKGGSPCTPIQFPDRIPGWDDQWKRLVLDCPETRADINKHRLSKIKMDLVEELENSRC